VPLLEGVPYGKVYQHNPKQLCPKLNDYGDRQKRNAYRLLVGKPERNRPLGRPRHRWVNNIRMDLVEVGWGDVDWIGLAQDRDRWRALVNAVLNLWVP
jgi:hypothetical protein